MLKRAVLYGVAVLALLLCQQSASAHGWGPRWGSYYYGPRPYYYPPAAWYAYAPAPVVVPVYYPPPPHPVVFKPVYAVPPIGFVGPRWGGYYGYPAPGWW